jgi:hypothetical protein
MSLLFSNFFIAIVNIATLYLVMQHGWDLLPDAQLGCGCLCGNVW